MFSFAALVSAALKIHWLLLFLALVSLLSAKRWRRRGLLATLVLTLLLSLPPIVRLMVPAAPQISLSRPPEAIVVLGAALARDGQDWKLGPYALARLQAAETLAEQHVVPVVFSGFAPPNRADLPSEAQMMRDWWVSRGNQSANLWLEDRSRNTWQNAKHSAVILSDMKIESAYLVTQVWHQPRALWSFKQQGIVAVPIVADDPYPLVDSWWPSLRAYKHWNLLLHEWIGILAYRMHYL